MKCGALCFALLLSALDFALNPLGVPASLQHLFYHHPRLPLSAPPTTFNTTYPYLPSHQVHSASAVRAISASALCCVALTTQQQPQLASPYPSLSPAGFRDQPGPSSPLADNTLREWEKVGKLPGAEPCLFFLSSDNMLALAEQDHLSRASTLHSSLHTVWPPCHYNIG